VSNQDTAVEHAPASAVVYDHATNYKRLIDAYGIAADRRGGWLDEMAGAFDHYPAEAVQRATDGYIRRVKVTPGSFVQVPPPGTFAEWVYQATDDLDAEAEGRRTPTDGIALPPPPAAPLALPAPEPPAVLSGEAPPKGKGIDREAWDRNLARGKAQGRNRARLIKEWHARQDTGHDPLSAVPEEVWKVRDEPTPEQIEAVLAEMRGGPAQSAQALYGRLRPGEQRTYRAEWADGEVSNVSVRRPVDAPKLGA
jgi:hypothetical protein